VSQGPKNTAETYACRLRNFPENSRLRPQEFRNRLDANHWFIAKAIRGKHAERNDMTTKGSEKLSLEIKRLIKAPRDRVYAAWTDPAQLKQWFGAENGQTHDFIAEVRVGGKFRWDLTSSEGERMAVGGEYRELRPGRK